MMKKILLFISFIIGLGFAFNSTVQADETMTYHSVAVISVDNEHDTVCFIADDKNAEPQNVHNVPMSEKIKLQEIVNQEQKSEKRFDVVVSNGNQYVKITRVADHKNFAQKLYSEMSTWQDKVNASKSHADKVNGVWSFIFVMVVIVVLLVYRWYFKNPVKTERK